MKKLIIYLRLFLSTLIVLFLITTSVWQPVSLEESIRPYTRPYEFDYASWTLNALIDKLFITTIGTNHYLTASQDKIIMEDYFQLLNEKKQLENSIETFFSDPGIENPDQEPRFLSNELTLIESALKEQSSLAESVIQKQVSITLNKMELTEFGQPFPPVLYHVTNLPQQLIISPRDMIEQSAAISLRADISLEKIIQLESIVEAQTDFSALVVAVGGVGTYPTMVISTSSMHFLLETVAHEWIHNYLAFRPLGLRYSSSPELRTMNETTASINGEEIRDAVIQNFYQDLLPAPEETHQLYKVAFQINQDSKDEPFDFNQEMYQTRIQVDALLAQGNIQEAEYYMESQRQMFWEYGFQIRKLNQAYFAFHGAYTDKIYSTAGEDPVGTAVRMLRSRSESLADFIQKMSQMTSYEDLYTLLNTY